MWRVLILVVALAILVGALAYKQSYSRVTSELSSQKQVDEIVHSSGKFDLNVTSGIWFNKPVKVPDRELAQRILANPEKVLGQNNGNKWIEVNLTTQHLYAHEGDKIVFDFPVSSGLPWFPTVTGDFNIWAKVRSQRMTGGSVETGTYYDLPNVPFVQYFYKGYGLHGTYWHNDFGKPRSHGCVNISIPNSEKLFYWTDPQLNPGEYSRVNIPADQGTRVVVVGTTPANIN